CALLLKHDHVVHNRFLRGFNNWFTRMTGRYERGVRFFMKRGVLALGVFAVMLVAVYGLFRSVPSSLAPSEDQGYVFVIGMLQDPEQERGAVEGVVGDQAAGGNSVALAGMHPLSFGNKSSSGIIWLPLKRWDERKGDDLSPQAVVGAVFGAGSQVKDGFFFAV